MYDLFGRVLYFRSLCCLEQKDRVFSLVMDKVFSPTFSVNILLKRGSVCDQESGLNGFKSRVFLTNETLRGVLVFIAHAIFGKNRKPVVLSLDRFKMVGR